MARSPGLLALLFVLLMAQFGVPTVQPVVTLFVQELVGARPDLATLSGIAFSVTSLSNVFAATFLGNRSEVIGGAVAAALGLRWVFLVTAAVLLANLWWVYYRMPEYVDSAAE